jgi:hypothetical protein
MNIPPNPKPENESANKKTLFVDVADRVDFVDTAVSINFAPTASVFKPGGSISIPSLNVVGGGVTGSMSTNLSSNISSSQNIDIIPINSGNSVKWFVFIEDGTNSRANKIVASWNYTSSTYYSNQFNEIGNVPVNFNVYTSGSNIYLQANPLSGSWVMKLMRMMV